MTVKTTVVCFACIALVACGRGAEETAKPATATSNAAEAPHKEDPNTVEVRIANDMPTGIRPTSLRLTIKGQMWNQPVPLELLLSADVDVDTGQAAVRDLRN